MDPCCYIYPDCGFFLILTRDMKTDELMKLLQSDKSVVVPHRSCGVCKEQMYWFLLRGKVHMMSCACRKSGKRLEIFYAYDDLVHLLG